MAAQAALQWTWELKGRLKSFQMYFLRIGAMLVEARDKKMYETLGHPDIEDYAEKRLNLARSTLYHYINVYEWVKKSHPEWLVKHPKGFIPDFSDVTDLMWIETKLADKNLNSDTRRKLEVLRTKGLQGKLVQRDLRQFRKKSAPQVDALQSYLTILFSVRRRGMRMKDIPAEVITKITGAIEIMQQAIAMKKAGDTPSQAA